MDNIPKFDFHVPQMPKINTPELLFTKIEPTPYERTVFKKQADDIKASFEGQIYALENIAQSAQRQADSATQQIEILKEQLAFAKSESESAKKDALFAKITSVIAIIISIVAIVVQALYG
ncbi:hypothetical protein 10S9_67 [uncultured Caudovirales phage]|uniref:Uncharacterized protein n=1 Tax=uncultured Caudovirales phage TaxID=2100421 RepID=A0A2H4JDW7_9CAUD|nr:hypothetical protein 10S9_67 [uncultured Caudovirales phage]